MEIELGVDGAEGRGSREGGDEGGLGESFDGRHAARLRATPVPGGFACALSLSSSDRIVIKPGRDASSPEIRGDLGSLSLSLSFLFRPPPREG